MAYSCVDVKSVTTPRRIMMCSSGATYVWYRSPSTNSQPRDIQQRNSSDCYGHSNAQWITWWWWSWAGAVVMGHRTDSAADTFQSVCHDGVDRRVRNFRTSPSLSPYGFIVNVRRWWWWCSWCWRCFWICMAFFCRLWCDWCARMRCLSNEMGLFI